MQLMACYRKQMFCFGILLFCGGCSSFQPDPRASLERVGAEPSTGAPVLERGDLKVSVRTNGKPVTNFQTPLVHRVEMTAVQSLVYFDPKSGRLQLPFIAQAEHDDRGKTTGIRVVRRSSPAGTSSTPGAGNDPAKLGLADKDLITAVNHTKVSEPTDIAALFTELRKSRTASMTIERGGVPHKILFYLPGS